MIKFELTQHDYRDSGGHYKSRVDRDMKLIVRFWNFTIDGNLTELAFVKSTLNYFMQAYWKRTSIAGRQSLYFVARQKDKKTFPPDMPSAERYYRQRVLPRRPGGDYARFRNWQGDQLADASDDKSRARRARLFQLIAARYGSCTTSEVKTKKLPSKQLILAAISSPRCSTASAPVSEGLGKSNLRPIVPVDRGAKSPSVAFLGGSGAGHGIAIKLQ